jgi:hypothetical protein
MLHEWSAVMFARTALFAIALAVTGCSKSQAPVQLHEPSLGKTPAIEMPLVASDKPELAPGQMDPTEFAHVVSVDGSNYIVLSSKPETEKWASGEGEASIVSRQNPVVVRRDVDLARLPKAMSRLQGRSMSLVGATGEVCRGTIGKPFLLSRVEPHFGERSRWEGEEDENGVKGPALSETQVAEIAWEMAGSDGKLLVAELQDSTGDCQDARFARAADLPALPVTAARAPAASLATQAKEALRKLPTYEAIEKSYRSSQFATPSVAWSESAGSDVTMLEFATGKGTYLWVTAAGGEVCSDFSGRMNVLWKVSGTNAKKFEFEVVYEGEQEFTPRVLLQLPGDSAPSLVGQESMLRKDQKVYGVEDLHVPFLDCPC